MFFAARSFRGGIHPHYHKNHTMAKSLEKMAPPVRVVIPLTQHLGTPNKPLVEVGQIVKVGQVLADTTALVAVPVHASVSGKIVALEKRPHPLLGKDWAVEIENDGLDQKDPSLKPYGSWQDLTADELRAAMRKIGLVGLGGAAFPTHVKYQPQAGKKIEMVILNGAECEPYLTIDHRLMVEEPGLVIQGLLALMKAAQVEKGCIGVEVNKKDAIAALKKETALCNNIQIVPLAAKYPQGEERLLIKAITGREVPSGKLPLDVGVVVNNVFTSVSFHRSLISGMPLVETSLTVSGPGIKDPRNLTVKVGTLAGDIVDQCGGLLENPPGKIIFGGPMTGQAQYRFDMPVLKATSGLLVFRHQDLDQEPLASCVHCGRCVDVCPYGLLPLYLEKYINRDRLAEAETAGLWDCRECGCCTSICPSRRPILQAVKTAKDELNKLRKKAQ
ncbi:MAG: electron transport complex subunit RsxC [Bacillota bacterium]